MEALEKAKLALRKHLLENKEKVVADLNAMRIKSSGNDISSYIRNTSNAFSLSNLATSNEIFYTFSFNTAEYYDFTDEMLKQYLYSPPPTGELDNRKKGSENLSGSFFLVLL